MSRVGNHERPRLPRALRAMGWMVLRHPLVLTVIVLPLALMLGSLAGFAVGRAGTPAIPYRTMRLQAVIADLGRIEGDYLLAAGDSHIERWPARRLCGLPVVNAGVSGATAGQFADFLADIPLPRHPRAVIVTLGTNDANSKRFRDPQDAVSRFDAGFQPLLANLTRTAGLVVITPMPPFDPRRVEGFSTEVASRIGAASVDACRASHGCIVADAFPAGLRQRDGLHFDDYASAYRGIATNLCATLAGSRSAAP